MAEPLITEDQLVPLIANGARSAAGEDIDPRPVVKLFTPDAGATWLITEADPDDPDRLFGLCDFGLAARNSGMWAWPVSDPSAVGFGFRSNATYSSRPSIR